jgi:CheY-like chemotaxis protein
MPITIEGREIRTILVIDDDKASREGYGFAVEDVGVETILQNDRIEDVQRFLGQLKDQDAIVSDHHLRKTSSYSPINGAELVCKCFDRRIPSVLVTRFEKSSVHEIRPLRGKIPVVLTPDKFNPETLVAGLADCVSELEGRVPTKRKTWRTLVRVDDCDEFSIVLFVPSWNRDVAVDLRRSEFPNYMQEILKPDLRVHAMVNIDAEDIAELFFTDWEPK